MKRLFIAVTATGLATVLVPVRSMLVRQLLTRPVLFLWVTDITPPNTRPMERRAPLPQAAWKKQFGRISTRPTAPFLVTLKLDAQSDWKVVKTHQMSDKEVDKKDKEQ
jgi:hypothetical protein